MIDSVICLLFTIDPLTMIAKYLLGSLFVIVFTILPLLVYGLSDIALWLTEGKAQFALYASFPLYCIGLLYVSKAWINCHNQQ